MYKKEIIYYSKLLYEKGMVNAYEGNLSIKDHNKIYITPSQKCKGLLIEDMIMTIDQAGHVLDGRLKISSEVGLHLEVYRLSKKYKAVIHAHSPYATAFAIANKAIESKAYPEMIALYKKVPVIKYGTPSTPAIYEDLKNYIDDYQVVLLENHGIVSYGETIEEAYYKLESIESIAKVLLLNMQLGGPSNLPDYEIKKLLSL